MMKRLIHMIFWRTVKKEYRGPMLDDSYKTVMVGQKNKVASQSCTNERKKLMVISMIIYIYSKPSSFIRTSA